MGDFWPHAGYVDLTVDDDGGLLPGDAWWRRVLQRPELALVDESCAAERALHERLVDSPRREVSPQELAALADPDARDNYRAFLAFRDRLLEAGTVQACYLAMFRAPGGVDVAPVFVDLLAQAICRHLLDDSATAFEARAAEMLFRPQRVMRDDGQVLAGDRERLDLLNQTGGFGELGRLLAQAQASWRRIELRVLSADNEAEYWASGQRHEFLLDLRHEVTQDLGHGVQFTLARAHSGLAALSRVLERWVAHLLGVKVAIEPLQRIDDAQWRWHTGLDAVSSSLLNDLYRGEAVEPARLQQLVSLFRLRFDDPQQMRRDVAGRPVYLGLASDADGVLRLKPQNLLTNLPLAPRA